MEVSTPTKRKSKVSGEIQTTLRVYFPRTRFSLKACNDRDYKVIKVSYTDGASLTRVKNAVSHFSFPSNPAIHFQGLRVEVSRNMSAGTKNLLLNELKSVFNLKAVPSEKDWVQAVNSTAGDYIRKIFRLRDFE